MGLSWYLQSVIERCYGQIISTMPTGHLLLDFRAGHILSDDGVTELMKYDTDKERTFRFLRTLKTLDDKDFYLFCDILQRNRVLAVHRLGLRLHDEAQRASEQQHEGKSVSNVS